VKPFTKQIDDSTHNVFYGVDVPDTPTNASPKGSGTTCGRLCMQFCQHNTTAPTNAFPTAMKQHDGRLCFQLCHHNTTAQQGVYRFRQNPKLLLYIMSSPYIAVPCSVGKGLQSNNSRKFFPLDDPFHPCLYHRGLKRSPTASCCRGPRWLQTTTPLWLHSTTDLLVA
jgi:hypothetical protein